jgi:hypothetical protein
VHGEELAYVLGMPLVGGTYHFVHNYTDQERRLSEHVMTFWVNFAKTGNPGSRAAAPGRARPGRAVFWPAYDASQRKHMVTAANTLYTPGLALFTHPPGGPDGITGNHNSTLQFKMWNCAVLWNSWLLH